MTGPLTAQRQRRRRITPNTNTTTTTMISTHNHVDMAASLSAQGQFAVTLLPPTRAGNSVTARRPPGRDELRARSPTPPPSPIGWPFGPRQPGQPQPYRPAPHETRTRQASPTRRDHSEPTGGVAAEEKRLPCVGRETIQAWCAETQWQTPRRRRRTDGARFRRHPNLRRGRLHRPALPVQPRSALRDPPRMGPAEVPRPRQHRF